MPSSKIESKQVATSSSSIADLSDEHGNYFTCQFRLAYGATSDCSPHGPTSVLLPLNKMVYRHRLAEWRPSIRQFSSRN